MSTEFRELLKKVAGGPHTSKALTREEAAEAMRLMLEAIATPAQIGGFLMAHRMKRPVAEELTGFLDAFDLACPPIPALDDPTPVAVLGNPYDGRTRTAPVTPLSALILAAVGIPVLMHGGGCLPTKFGLPLIEIWDALGVQFRGLDRDRISELLGSTKVSFLYAPDHFPATDAINIYRAELGKRPPMASVELMWTPYAGPVNLIAGFVHPPTEQFIQDGLALRGLESYTLIKGLEGSGDLPRERTTIASIQRPGEAGPQRVKLHARDYGLEGPDLPLESVDVLVTEIQTAIAGQETDYSRAGIWNGGFYLWSCGAVDTIELGFEKARSLLESGAVAEVLTQLQQATRTPVAV